MSSFRAHSAPLNAKATMETNKSFEMAGKTRRTSSAIADEEHQNRR